MDFLQICQRSFTSFSNGLTKNVVHCEFDLRAYWATQPRHKILVKILTHEIDKFSILF